MMQVDSLLHCGAFHIHIPPRVRYPYHAATSAFGASEEEVVDRWVGAACVLAGVFGHALLQRATGVIHAALLLLRLRRFVNKST